MGKEVVLLADNALDFLRTRKEFLEAAGYTVLEASNPEQARDILRHQKVDVALVDIRLRDDNDDLDMSGFAVIRDAPASVSKILLTGFASVEFTRLALKERVNGKPLAVDFVEKQEGPEAMLRAVEVAFLKRRARLPLWLRIIIYGSGLFILIIIWVMSREYGLKGSFIAIGSGIIAEILGFLLERGIENLRAKVYEQ